MVRRFHKGEVVCRQGEPGWTAFYILTSEDVLKLLEALPKESLPERERRGLEAEGRRPADARRRLGGGVRAAHRGLRLPDAGPPRAGEEAGLVVPAVRRRPAGPARRPLSIPIDGPTDLKYDDPKATLREGELFGEMSCFYRTPRSATVVADRDCYVLEMLRNILDQLKKDVKFKKRLDDDYRKRTLDLQVRNIPLFQDLGDDLLAKIRDKAELKTYVAGQVLVRRARPLRRDVPGPQRPGEGGQGRLVAVHAGDAARWKPPADGPPAEAGPGQALVDGCRRTCADGAGRPGRAAARSARRPPTPSTPRSKGRRCGRPRSSRPRPAPPSSRRGGAAAGRRQAPAGTGRPLAEPGAGGDGAARRLDVPTAGGRLGDGAALRRPGRADRRDRPDDRRSPQRHLRGLYPPAQGQAQKQVDKQEEEIVEVVRIGRPLFDELKQDPSFRRKVEEIIAQRRRSDARRC